MNLKTLLEPWQQVFIEDIEILDLQNDSRAIKPGALFMAYPGALTDGRRFMEQAVLNGASAVLYEPFDAANTVTLPTNVPCIAIPQLSEKLAQIADRFYGSPSQHMLISGVTGTNGKTTIAYQLTQAFSLLNQRASYIGTLGHGDVHALQPLNNTTPDALCLQRCLYDDYKRGVQRICMEVSSHALSQGRVDKLAFHEAIYTNLSLDHLDYHHTMEEYAAAKARLFAFPELKWAIINQDDAYASMMEAALPATCQKLTYGMHRADVRPLHWDSSLLGSHIDVISPWGTYTLWVRLLGKFNMYNSLAVFASLLMNGFAPTDIVHVMERLRASPGRMEQVAQKPCVIVDYAHTPDALENVLLTIQQIKQGRVFVVFGCGGDRDKSKRPIMGRIASEYADYVVVTSDNPRTEDPYQIIEEVAAGLLPNTKAEKIEDREQAIHHALSMMHEQDVLLIAGKGHEAYQQIGTERHPFSDQLVVRKYLGC